MIAVDAVCAVAVVQIASAAMSVRCVVFMMMCSF